ncbi:hypothetical protein ISS03_01665 [Patescibacteria group bacterium]|nr:hypothetical protein [Patescibacteria group bacterium]
MDNKNFGDRQSFTGKWKCSECQAEITELPFKPDGERPLFCRDCHRSRKSKF